MRAVHKVVTALQVNNSSPSSKPACLKAKGDPRTPIPRIRFIVLKTVGANVECLV